MTLPSHESRTRRAVLRDLGLATLAAGASRAGGMGPPPSDPGEAEALTGRERLAWFEAARFGLFLHWGPYSVAGVEASWPIMVPPLARLVPQPAITEVEYVALARRFEPVAFDPDAWVRLAREAGMRYVVLTAKHHDGFCMFDAPGTDYKITRSPYGRDICAQLAEACARAGMPLGFYYSPPDMHHHGYRDTSRPVAESWTGDPSRPAWREYLDYMEAHLRKLLTGYGEVAILWFDGLFDHDRYDPPRFHRLIRELSPRTLINDRLGPGDYITPEQFFPSGIPVRRRGPPPVITEEAFLRFFEILTSGRSRAEIAALLEPIRAGMHPTAPLPVPAEFQPWETCMTMNDTWAYNPSDTSWKSPERLLRTLIEVASRGGNFLLNVGPSGAGTFPPEAIERLQWTGRWIAEHGEAIHGTSYGPLQGHPSVRSTEKGDVVYLYLLDQATGRLELDSFPGAVARARLLGADVQSLRFERSEQGLSIELPVEPTDPVTVLAIERR